MTTPTPLRAQIEHALGKVAHEQLAKLWEYLQQLQQEPVAALYTLHEYAINTEVSDLAEHHDSYLYDEISGND